MPRNRKIRAISYQAIEKKEKKKKAFQLLKIFLNIQYKGELS